jgi:hypothetical protein
MSLEEVISQVQVKLRKGEFPNEYSVSISAVLPILQALEWPVLDSAVVFPQYRIETQYKREKRFVDFALLRSSGNPAVFLEAKKVGAATSGEMQLFEYAFHKGVRMVILTDGQEWHFFLPAEEGDYEERRAYKLDLLERDLPECVNRLKRYLSRTDVMSGVALDSARSDYQDNSRRREIDRILPQAWENLLNEADESLLEPLADKVEDLCGYRPDADACIVFLTKISGHTTTGNPPIAPTTPPTSTTETTHSTSLIDQRGFILNGQQHPCRFAVDVLESVFNKFSDADPTFPERFAARKQGRTRRYLAQNKYDLYPDNPAFADTNSRELHCGWNLGTHSSNALKEKILRMACEVAGMRFGTDLIIRLD